MQGSHGRNVDLETALEAARADYTQNNPRSLERNAEAAAVMPGGNTRTVLHYPPFPLTIARGEGATLWDLDGHRYTDFLGEYTAGLYGHSNPEILGAVREALDGGVDLGGPNLMEARLARLICERFPAVERVRFTNSGTEANLMAIGSARAFTGRSHMMAFHGGYHGGILYFASPSPVNAPYPTVLATYNDIDGTRALIREHGAALACVILEPMVGGGGCIEADPKFLAMLREETRAAGALLIFDEVMTSRLAPGGLHGALGLDPDLVTLGKYLGGGMSFGAFGGRADIMDRFDPNRPDAWPHAGTFNNNVLTMSAGVAGLTRCYTPEAAVQLNERGDRLRRRLQAIVDARDLPMSVTGRGSMMNVHFTDAPIRGPQDLKAVPQGLRDILHLDLLQRGYYLARRGMINLSLPMTDGDLDGLVAAFDEILSVRGALITATVGSRRRKAA